MLPVWLQLFFASQLLWYVATKSHRVHFKLFWSSVDWKSPMWPSLVFTTFICTLWVDSMCFSKYSVLFNVLSKRLHWISHLFLSTCLFKPSALLKTARQFSHLNSSLTHFAMWLFLLLYGILFSQWLHVTSLCVFSFMPPMHFFSHFSQVRTRSSCFAWICILRCFSKGASMRQMAQEDRWTDGWMRTSVCGTGRSKSAAYVCPNLPRKMRH